MRRILVLATIALGGVALLGASGVAQSSPTPRERVRAGADATAAAGSARFDGAIEDADASEVLSFSGALTLDGLDGELGIGLGGSAEGSTTTRAVDGTYFVELTSLVDVLVGEVGELPASVANRRWVRVDPRQLADVGFGVSGADPAAQLAMLRAMTRIEEVGPEAVLGEPATHFRGFVDLDRALRRAPRAERARLEPAFDSFARDRVPVDVWLDTENRLRRFDAEVAVQGFEDQDEGAEGTLSTLYFDFGTEVSAEAPPRRSVVGFSEFLDAVREAAAEG